MDSVEAKETLYERATTIDSEQFEQLSKIVVEEVENPRNIELTPFGGDGGIDVRGTYGKNFFDARFGVQVKQHRGNVGSPAMRDFVGALTQHEYQFGSFLTSSDFTSGAVELAEQESIVLVDGDQLTDVMIAYEIGVNYDGFDYELDPDFWEIFKKTGDTELVPSEAVPQADSLDVLHVCLEAIADGRRYKPEITEYMTDNTSQDDWASRQADYYPIAGWALGYIHKDTIGEYDGREMRQWGLTRDGTEYLELVRQGQEEAAKDDLSAHIREAAVMERILPVLEEQGELSRDELVEILRGETELSGTTPPRRASTVGNWLEVLPEVNRRQDGRSIKWEYLRSNLNDYVEDS